MAQWVKDPMAQVATAGKVLSLAQELPQAIGEAKKKKKVHELQHERPQLT